MVVLRMFLIAAGAFGVADTLFVGSISNLNLGVVLPAILGVPLLLLGIFMHKLAVALPAGWWQAVKWVYLVGYSLAVLLFAGTWMKIDSAVQRRAPEDLDVVIVLGAGLRGERPTRVLRQRMDVAVAYLNRHPEAVAVFSGGMGEGETITEAEAMARYATEKGIAENRFFKEENARNTKENFINSYTLIMEEYGEDAKIGYVTTDFHVYRAGLVAKKQGIEAVGIPAPDIWYITLNNHLRECIAVWGYWIRGDI